MKKCCTCKLDKPLESFGKDAKQPKCKECMAAWHLANREVRNARARQRYQDNKEQISTKQKAYYLENSEIILQKNRDYYHKNLESQRARNRAKDRVKERERLRKYYEENKELMQARRRENYSAGGERMLELKRSNGRKRRARKLNNGIEPYKESEVLEMYGTNCHLCGSEIDLAASRKTGIGDWENGLHIDHVIPLSQGGADALHNVKPAHATCNLRKNRK